MGDSTAFSIRDRQKESLLRMLSLESGAGSVSTISGSGDEPWKVVVFDKFGGDILALVLRVGDLRRHGVTLTLRLDDDARQAIPDAPAVYFISPSRRCAMLVARDCSRGLYDGAYIHATSSFPRAAIEELATATLASSSSHRIRRVYDQHAAFLSLDNDLFVAPAVDPESTATTPTPTYVTMNDPAVSDADAQALTERIAAALFSAVVTMGVVPVIRAPRNTAASIVAEKLHERVQAHVAKEGSARSSSSFSSASASAAGTSLHRPLLIILDRNADLSVMLAHPWTYRALVHELLEFDLNMVTIPAKQAPPSAAGASSSQEAKQQQPSRFDVDTATDKFWASHTGSPFPTLAVEFDNEVKSYQSAADEINRFAKGIGAGDDFLGSAAPSAGTIADLEEKGLSRFVDRLPALREQKREIDIHKVIAPALLERIKAREIDTLFFSEEPLLTRQSATSAEAKEIAAIVTSGKVGTVEDRLRLFLIWFLTSKTSAPADLVASMEQALDAAGADMRAVAFVKRAKAFADSSAGLPMTLAAPSPIPGSMAAASGAAGSSGGGLITSIFETMYSGVRALLPKSANYQITRIVEALMDLRGAQLGIEESYLYLDPKLATKQTGPGAAPVPRKTTPFHDAIVFVIGGGNFVEHQNLADLAKRSSQAAGAAGVSSATVSGVAHKRIIYGTTEIVHPTKFLEMLGQLGAGLSPSAPRNPQSRP